MCSSKQQHRTGHSYGCRMCVGDRDMAVLRGWVWGGGGCAVMCRISFEAQPVRVDRASEKV
jgi:hypothetical protein